MNKKKHLDELSFGKSKHLIIQTAHQTFPTDDLLSVSRKNLKKKNNNIISAVGKTSISCHNGTHLTAPLKPLNTIVLWWSASTFFSPVSANTCNHHKIFPFCVVWFCWNVNSAIDWNLHNFPVPAQWDIAKLRYFVYWSCNPKKTILRKCSYQISFSYMYRIIWEKIPILKSLTARKKPAHCFEWATKALR